LHKCWLGFVIAKDHDEWDKIDLYARRIQKLERELEIEITDFSEWGIE
jgi:phage head maturation protease